MSMTDTPRPIDRARIIKHGNSPAVLIGTDAREVSGLGPGDQLHGFRRPDGSLLYVSNPDDPAVTDLTHVETRTLREWSSVYLGLGASPLGVLGVGIGDHLEISAAPGRIALRPWD